MRETVCDSGKKDAHVSILALSMLCHLPAVLWGNRGVETKTKKKTSLVLPWRGKPAPVLGEISRVRPLSEKKTSDRPKGNQNLHSRMVVLERCEQRSRREQQDLLTMPGHMVFFVKHAYAASALGWRGLSILFPSLHPAFEQYRK